MSLFLQMKEKLPSIYVIKHEVKFIIRLENEKTKPFYSLYDEQSLDEKVAKGKQRVTDKLELFRDWKG